MIDIVFDMETSDPDDLFTLFLLAGHPRVNLKAVTVFPGAPDQIGLIRHMLSRFQVDIPIGAGNLDSQKPGVSQWYYDVFGNIEPSRDAASASDILLGACDEATTLLTGAPLKNIGRVIQQSIENPSREPFRAGRWIAQGGFAGVGVVPPEKQLDKFKGLRTCPTHNLSVDNKSAQRVIDWPHLGTRHFVSKNVCHGVYYDQAMHDVFTSLKDKHLAFSLIWQGMDAYLKEYPDGKKFHDPLAACCAIDLSIGEWAEVELFREQGEWGARLATGSNTWIIVDYDRDKFVQVMTKMA
jgi:pyrimidine-specific ribonucleoside hydrolase